MTNAKWSMNSEVVGKKDRVKRSLKRSSKSGNEDVPAVEGGPASAGAVRGFTYWMNIDGRSGLTIKADASVTLSCEIDLKSVQEAGVIAGQMALELAKEGFSEMQEESDQFVDGLLSE